MSTTDDTSADAPAPPPGPRSGDGWVRFVSSDLGGRIAGALGLPRPTPLRRHVPGQPPLDGPVLVGASGDGRLLDHATTLLHAAGVELHEQAAAGVRYAGVVHDAAGVASVADLDQLWRGVQAGVRQLADNARVVVLGDDPDTLDDVARRTAQRALEGFVRSVGKEVGRGATANLVLAAPGAEDGVDAPLRFLLSARSTFVSGQAIVVGPPTATAPRPPEDLDRPLADRVAVVTGAARGIGEAIVEVLARDGAHVVCVDLPSAGDDLARVANGARGEAVGLDITDRDAPATLVDHLGSRHGRVDVVVHNAGVTRDRTLKGMDEARWDLVVDVNVLAPQRIDEALLAADLLGDQGRVVCMSSAIGGIAGNRGQTNYAVSKAGIIGHVEALAPTLATRGATINAAAPGFIETSMTGRMPIGPRELGRRMSSLGQGGLPVDVAETVAFLSWPDAAWINGRTLRVCGQHLLGA